VELRLPAKRRGDRRGRCLVARCDATAGRGRGRPLDLRGGGHWGDENPWGVPFFIVTHRPEEQPPGGAFTFVDGVERAVALAREGAGDKDVSIMGGADVIRQALEAGLVDKLSLIIAPLTLGGGKRLFEGFTTQLELKHEGVRQSPFATFVDYRVKK
jgi:dihydrofolate reductase